MDKLETLIVEAKATLGSEVLRLDPRERRRATADSPAIEVAHRKLERALDELRRLRRDARNESRAYARGSAA